MNKTELIKKVSQLTESTQLATTPVVEAVLTAISETLKNGESIKIRDFGTFSVKATAERQGRNPATGEPLTIEAGRKVKFKAADGLI